MGILDSIGTYLGDEENRLRLASGFQGLSMNPNAANIQQGFQNRLGDLREDRKLKTAKELADSKLQLQTSRALQLIGDEYSDVAQAIQGGFMTPNEGMAEVMRRRNLPEKERKTIKGADGYNYYIDTGDRVLSGVEKTVTPPTKSSVEKKFDFFKSQNYSDEDAMRMATTTVTSDANAQTAGQKKVDEAYADDYILWTQGGGADMSGQLAQVGSVLTDLEAGVPLTGPTVGALGQWGNFALSIFNPKAANAKEKVQEVVQRNLRIILGAQFTAKEGELLISRAYNETLPPEQNAARLRKLILQMQNAVQQKNAMSAFFEKNGTLTGYKGQRPTVNNFFEAMSGFTKGQVVNGFRYLGGDHKVRSNWEKV